MKVPAVVFFFASIEVVIAQFGPNTRRDGTCKSKVYTYKGNAQGKCCVFPFIYKGKEYKECTNVDKTYRWCATTSNYDTHREFGRCPDQEKCPSHVYTTGGTAKGACCVFPFMDGKKVHHSCAEAGSGKTGRWCATTENYNSDKMWGYCSNQEACPSGMYTAYGNSDYACCHFPFQYKGKVYTECTEKDSDSSWCATTAKYDWNRGIGKYGYCPKKKETCTVEKQTYGGNAGNDCCVFPFQYNGQLYPKCTNVDSQIGEWCATTNNFDKDRKFGFCKGPCDGQVQTFGGDPGSVPCCHFPFTYNNKKYLECTTDESVGAWCSTTSDFEYDWKYGYCGPAKSVDSKCKFQLGEGDGESIKIGKVPRKDCIQMCRDEKKKGDSWITGVRVYSTEEENECYCIRNMTASTNKLSNFISCFLEDTVVKDNTEQFERDMYHETDWY